MRKNYLKGVLLFIFMTIGVCLATTMFTKDNIQKLSEGLETQYSNGRAFEPGEAGYAVVKIINIEETNIEDDKLSDGEKFYLVEHDKGTTMLKATPDEVKKMLGDSVTKDSKLYNIQKPIYAKIKGFGPKTGRKNRTITVPDELREKFEGAYKSSYIRSKKLEKILADYKKGEDKTTIENRAKEKPFYVDIYMETLGSTYNLLTLGGNAIAILISLWMLKTIYRRVRGNKESYERLFVAYPETERDLDIILREATFSDEQLNILIYKNMFISYRTVFIVEYIADIQSIENLVDKYEITQIYHLAALLSAVGERNPLFTWQINMQGLLNVLEVARKKTLYRVYWPSSIAAFGLNTPMDLTPQHTVTDPNTVYGITKVAGELWCQYYFQKYGVDVRSLRYPGLIGYKTLPGGGTTDYAVDIYHKAIKGEVFECFLSENTYLPMMYMPDALNACVQLMEADPARLVHYNGFNIASMSFDPEAIYTTIKKYRPQFEMVYEVDPLKQSIADSWPNSLDDSCARQEWDWKPQFDIDSMSEDMVRILKARYNK